MMQVEELLIYARQEECSIFIVENEKGTGSKLFSGQAYFLLHNSRKNTEYKTLLTRTVDFFQPRTNPVNQQPYLYIKLQ